MTDTRFEGSFEGTDDTGAVRAFVDDRGTVLDFEVAADWRRTLDSRRLGEAVQQAVLAAGMAGVGGWADRMAAVKQDPVIEPPSGAINPSQSAAQHALSLLERARRERAAGTTRPSERVEGRSAGGHVTVTMVDGRLVEVAVASRWNGGHLEVAGELRSAFHAAARTAPICEPSAAAEIAALTADPREFLASMFGVTTSTGGHHGTHR